MNKQTKKKQKKKQQNKLKQKTPLSTQWTRMGNGSRANEGPSCCLQLRCHLWLCSSGHTLCLGGHMRLTCDIWHFQNSFKIMSFEGWGYDSVTVFAYGAEGPQPQPPHCVNWVWQCTPVKWRQEDQKFSHHLLQYLGQGQLRLHETLSQKKIFFSFFENEKEKNKFNPRYRKYRLSHTRWQGQSNKGTLRGRQADRQ